MKELRGKRLLVLGGSIWKDAIKKFAQDNGVVLISAGLYPAGTDDIADEVYRIDTTVEDLMIPFFKDHQIDGAYMGGSELIISSACEYLNKLGLPCYCTKEQWEYLQNKANFKRLCIDSGLPVVPQYVIDPEHIKESVPSSAYPVITKPSDGCGSNGFSVCRNADELVAGYAKAAADSPTASVICEKFVKNTGVVVFYTFSDGEVIFSGLEDKYPVRFSNHDSYVGGLFVFKSRFTEEYCQRFNEGVARMFHSIGVKEGSAWIEVFHDGENYYFNEVGFRYGGSISIYPVDYLTGINQVAADIYYALTGESMPYGHNPLVSASFDRGLQYAVYPVYADAGCIADVQGLDSLGENVVFSTMTKSIGYTLHDQGSFNQNVAIVQFVYRDRSELEQTIHNIHQNLRVLDSEGKNLVLSLLDVRNIDI